MTIINRALHKAYKRRSDAQPAVALQQRAATATGWASNLREPVRPIPMPERAAAAPGTVTTVPEGSLALPVAPARRKPEGPVVVPASTTVRVDSPHAPSKGPLLVDTRSAAPQPTESRLAETTDRSRGKVAEPAIGPWAWPPVVQKLLNCPAGAEIRQLAGRLMQLASERSLGCLALSGPGRAAGRTSLVLTLARALTESCSARVAIVDADFGHPDVARMISVRPRSGLWNAACEKGLGSSPVMTLIPGKLALVPLVARVSPEAIDRRKIAALQTFLQVLRRGYDLVLVDAGPWESLIPPLVFENRTIDGFICVSRYNDDDEQLDDATYRQPGIEWLGTIETFTPASQLELQTV